MRRQLLIHDCKAFVDESNTAMHAVHGAANVTRAGNSDEAMEGDKCFGFRPSSVEEWSTENVHALHVDSRLGPARFRSFCGGRCRCILSVLNYWRSMLELRASELGSGVGHAV